MKKTNICIAGNFNIAVECSKFLLKKFKNIKLYAVFNLNDNGKDNFQKSFKKFCKNNSKIIPIDIKEAYKIKDLIFISLHYDKILKTENFISKKLYNFHFSLLPKYKGMHTTAWPIIYGENYTGVTLHKIDNGIDTGNIISQKSFKILLNDNAEKVFLKYIKYAIILFKKKIRSLLLNNYVSKKQISENSSYFSKDSINFKIIKVDLNKTAFEIHNKIRAFIFKYYQLPTIKGYQIEKTRILKSKSDSKPGNIISRYGKYLKISTVDYNLLLKIK